MNPEAIASGLPLLRAQSEFWVGQQLDPGNAAYNTASYLDIRGPLDVGLYRAALRRTVAEAECLRARFASEGGGPRQTFDASGECPLPVIDLTGETAPFAAATAAMDADLTQPFDLETGPLFRFFLWRVGPERFLHYGCVHHIVTDGFSQLLTWTRLAEIYNAMLNGRDAAEGALPRFSALLDNESGYLVSGAFAQDERFWRSRYPQVPELSSLSDRPPTAPRGNLRSSAVLPQSLTSLVKSRSWEARTTWRTCVVAAAGLYVQRMTGNRDALLTMAVSGRVGPRARAVPGPMANFLPLHLRLDPSATRSDALRATSAEIGHLVEHQRFRGVRARKLMGLDPADRRPFGPTVNLMNYGAHIMFGECRATLADVSSGPVDDFQIIAYETPDSELGLHVNANPGMYSEDDLAGHRRRFVDFLERFALVEEDTPIGRIDALHAIERSRLLTEWNDSARADGHHGVVERVRSWAESCPDTVAVVDDAGTLSYGSLVRRASAVSRTIERGSLVAVLADPGARFVAAVLGVWGAGAAYVPLDPGAPAARLKGLLADSRAGLLLAGPEYADLAAGISPTDGSVRVVRLGEAEDRALAPAAGVEDELAYVMYTSGSTGKPKGAMVHRGGMMNHLLAKAEELSLTSADCVMQNAPLTFDISVWQIFSGLIAGSRVRIVSPDVRADPDNLFGLVENERATILEVVPSLLRATLDAWDSGSAAPDLAELRWLIVTGEVLQPDLCQRWFERWPSIPMMNAYGPTECSDDVTHAVLRPGDIGEAARIPIGRVLRNMRLYVLDGDLLPVPAGIPGELYVGGQGVGRGYLHDPVRTAASFVPDPFSPVAGTRMYRTGDRVRYLPDGRLEFVERLDFQVKVRGHRIELGEVETALRLAPGVSDAVVDLRPDAAGQPQLAGYIVGDADPAAVRAAVSEVLPDYMVPSTVTVLAELPLTAHRKVDRAALPTPEAVSAAGSRGPRGAWEGILCGLFEETLGVRGIGAEDNFFDLGGHSLLAIRLAGRVRAVLGVELPLSVLFNAPTVSRLATRLAGSGELRRQLAPASTPPPTPSPGGH
ncbi:amino acid adenylation domain-containing protein [Amycolatopsis sp. NPDC059090]|uniref:amino acid adenylation domain-containing protein n=1 Tax=Amycolatopsis sp. NPDC059090 TaxID=3346723 RepID=UPI003671FF89